MVGLLGSEGALLAATPFWLQFGLSRNEFLEGDVVADALALIIPAQNCTIDVLLEKIRHVLKSGQREISRGASEFLFNALTDEPVAEAAHIAPASAFFPKFIVLSYEITDVIPFQEIAFQRAWNDTRSFASAAALLRGIYRDILGMDCANNAVIFSLETDLRNRRANVIGAQSLQQRMNSECQMFSKNCSELVR